jgi:manganese catalase
MYHHVKQLMFTVRVDEPDVAPARCCWSNLAAGMVNLPRRCNIRFRDSIVRIQNAKDLLMDIGTEELSHLEVVGCLSRMHLKPSKFDREAAEADPLVAIAGGGGVNLFNSQGSAWTADYLKITGELDVDLRSNIAAEARAKSSTSASSISATTLALRTPYSF